MYTRLCDCTSFKYSELIDNDSLINQMDLSVHGFYSILKFDRHLIGGWLGVVRVNGQENRRMNKCQR